MATQWYVYSDSGQEGPYSAEQLKQMLAENRITQSTFLWKEGLAEWTQYSAIAELQHTAPPAAKPPAPKAAAPAASAAAAPAAAAATAQPAQKQAEPAKSEKPKKKMSTGFVVLIVILLLLGGGSYAAFQMYPDEVLALIGMAPPPPPPAPPKPAVPPMNPDEKSVRALFAQYDSALQTFDAAALKKLLAQERISAFDGPETMTTALIESLLALRPEAVAIDKVKLVGDSATLTLKSSSGAGEAIAVKEDGAWKIFNESWKLPAPAGDTALDTAAAAAPGLQSIFAPREYAKGSGTLKTTGTKPPSLPSDEDDMVLMTGLFSKTRIDDPKTARLEFRIANAPLLSSPQRVEISLDISRKGNQVLKAADGTIKLVTDDGLVFVPKDKCTISISQPYSGAEDGTFVFEIKECVFAGEAFEFKVSGTFTVSGVPK